MIHLPVLENRIAQFAARFEAWPGGGWVYWDDGSGALPVSDTEHALLIADHRAALKLGMRVLYGWLAVAVIGLFTLSINTRHDLSFAMQSAILLLPMPWVLWIIWQAERAPIELAGRRIPVQPPRSFQSGAKTRLAALPDSVPAMMIGTGALLIIQLVRLDQVVSDPLLLALGAGIAAFGIAIFRIKRTAR